MMSQPSFRLLKRIYHVIFQHNIGLVGRHYLYRNAACVYVSWCDLQKPCYIFRYRRTAHVTPKSYLSFISAYKNVYSSKRAEINELSNRMNLGLGKLFEASKSVEELSIELAQKKQELAIAGAKADEVLKEVSCEYSCITSLLRIILNNS